MTRFGPRLGLAFILLACLLLPALPLPVFAQGGTVLAVDPAQSSVEVNGEREIHLLVTDADNLNAFDVQVEYDSDLLTLVRWEFGDLLSNLAVVKRDDLPGSFRLVATQLATPGVSGDGVLLKLFFKGKVEGNSAVTITKAEFARSEGGLSLPEVRHGNITIIPAQPTATPTQTPTATATLAPTATSTATATATLAATGTATLAATSTSTLAPSATPTATTTPTATRAVTGTLAAGLTPVVTQSTQGAAVTFAPTGAAGATDAPGGDSGTPVVGTEEMAATAQPEPTRAAEGGEAPLGTTGQGGASGTSGGTSGTSGGNGTILRKTRGSGPTATGVILFIGGMLLVGGAAVVYSTREKRVNNGRRNAIETKS